MKIIFESESEMSIISNMNIYDDIKIVAMDVDSTLTDGIYQISEQEVGHGIVTKSFYTRDFYAIEQLMRAGILVCIITQSHDKVIERQVQRIASHSDFWSGKWNSFNGLKVLTGINNKKKAIKDQVLMKSGFDWHNVAYIGDAENDVTCMKKALFTGCPADAIEEVKENVNYISEFPGGRGAVYDFCMHILKQRKNNE